MKKMLAISILLFTRVVTFGQINAAIEIIEVEDKMFRGSINEKNNITIYLRYCNPSDDHLSVYSLKGWYYYDNDRKKMPLVGIYDGDLTLFQFNSKDKKDTILDFIYEDENFWSKMEYLKNLQGFEEKLVIGSRNEWISGTKKLPIYLQTNDFTIKKRTEILKVNINDAIKCLDLNDIALYDRNFELISFNTQGNKIKFLLKFEYSSRPYVLGRCGAGGEIGFLILTYDSQFYFIESQRILLESCLEGKSYEELKTQDMMIRSYKITDEDMKESTIVVDSKNISIRTVR